ncbi:60S ribosomal protein L17 [Platysternon megacephalum]|uniref:60S ribosomal protein L17 n=1 Tax=Platysternon megacephalum TaxID=55544 RepID=A0A4D9EIP9_9SAUR|nr:60S ribosomal protein L17 [Platysternon megacephalum]
MARALAAPARSRRGSATGAGREGCLGPGHPGTVCERQVAGAARGPVCGARVGAWGAGDGTDCADARTDAGAGRVSPIPAAPARPWPETLRASRSFSADRDPAPRGAPLSRGGRHFTRREGGNRLPALRGALFPCLPQAAFSHPCT